MFSQWFASIHPWLGLQKVEKAHSSKGPDVVTRGRVEGSLVPDTLQRKSLSGNEHLSAKDACAWCSIHVLSIILYYTLIFSMYSFFNSFLLHFDPFRFLFECTNRLDPTCMLMWWKNFNILLRWLVLFQQSLPTMRRCRKWPKQSLLSLGRQTAESTNNSLDFLFSIYRKVFFLFKFSDSSLASPRDRKRSQHYL